MSNANYFAKQQYRDYLIYQALERSEPVPEFKKILASLIQQEYEDYTFWVQFSTQKNFSVSRFAILGFKFLRKICGLTFTAKFLEGRESAMVQRYCAYLKTVDPNLKPTLEKIIAHEQEHERKFIAQIKEERLQFLGNIVLGLNDGLIELSGALTGFSFAFTQPLWVAFSGVIVGFAAALSMAASAYMQARHEVGKPPVRAALYTGVAYLAVVLLLVAPFFIFSRLTFALPAMFSLIFLIIIGLSFYSAVLRERSFVRQVVEMTMFSVGVASVAFVLGILARRWVPELARGLY